MVAYLDDNNSYNRQEQGRDGTGIPTDQGAPGKPWEITANSIAMHRVSGVHC